ncbi:MAG: cell wall hydrolase [Aureispira sp.]|nr:cell wall hydrolase [Aureispira sp.]
MEIGTIEVPTWMMDIKYNFKVIPNGELHDLIKTGANCQVFAYYLLRYHNRVVPDLRSSELWDDTTFSEQVPEDYEPLDILFFHKKKDAYGAHLAVFIGDNKAVHNSKKIGKPVIWNLETFSEKPEYKFLLGGKRFFKDKTH